MEIFRILALLFVTICSAQPPSLFLPADKCWISPKFRQECGFAGIAGSECVRRGCCFDVGSRDVPPCFYSLDNLPVCTKDGRVLIAISKDLTLPPVNLTTVHLKDGHGAECSPTVASVDTVLFEFALTECGTSQRLDGVDVVYETDVLAQFEILDGALGSVSRDSPFRLHVQCSYKGSQESELQLKPRVYTLSPPLPATETGILLLELRIARDAAYRSWYVASDYPILSVLREPVFVEVRVLNRNDPSLVLVLNECWASPTAEPYSQLQWKLLVNRCPFTGDNYKSRLLPLDAASHLRFPTHHKRFVVSTFTFWERVSGRPLSGEVYFHCSAEVCSPSSRENCTASCSPMRRRSTNNQPGTLVTTGPIIFLEDGERLSAGIQQEEKVCTKDGRVLIAISKDLTLPPVNLTTVHLKDGHGAECSPTVASVDTVLFEFALTECGTSQRLDGVDVVYETDVLAQFEILDGALGSVSRDSPFRCPFTGDNYKSRLLPLDAASHLRFPTHHKRFVVSTFTFWERVSGRPLSGEVYFHCSAEVCSPSSRENCTASCSPMRRRSTNNQPGTLVTTGPIIFLEDGERLSAGIQQEEKDAAVDSPSLVLPGVAVGVALLSVALLVGTVAVWKMDVGHRVGSECRLMEL
ncbi:zona pellucida sperm-binding protein 4-like isoform X3 [Heterodontus francisci]|uniref:zona pellucida sperm-binding protein 4-like isoform X3 n=1 Tax=Heterodontus francisci TaxID=7792 RepID=UPI00355C1FC5